MSMKRILLLFGAGARTGTPIANKFSAAGYHVAVVGRSQDESASSERVLNIKADLADPTSVKGVFEKVHAKFGAAPNVVVYNAASNHPVSGSNPFSVPLADWQANLNINVTSLYEAGREAVAGFANLPAEQIKTFISVGNKANAGFVSPAFVTNGSGKNAAAYIMACAAKAFASDDYCNFYYADQRTEDGEAVYARIDGPAHGDFFLQLAERKEQGPWLATFVKGKGYAKF